MRKVNELSPSSLSLSLTASLSLPSLSPVGETARHKANEVHLLTKRGGLPDTLIKCALETEVSETEGSSLKTSGPGSDQAKLPRHLQIEDIVHLVAQVEPNITDLFNCLQLNQLAKMFCNRSWISLKLFLMNLSNFVYSLYPNLGLTGLKSRLHTGFSLQYSVKTQIKPCQS